MYVVGSALLSGFWSSDARAEGELRALHALLSSLEPDDLEEALKHLATFDGAGADIRMATAAVRIEISRAAGVIRYVSVSAVEEEAG